MKQPNGTWARAIHSALFLAVTMIGTTAIGSWASASDRTLGYQDDRQQVATRLDQLLQEELWQKPAQTPISRADNYRFIRRVTLDTTGHLPTVEQIRSFVADISVGKRQALVARLLNDQRYGSNWASYWRDVIMYRRSEDRALLAAKATTEYLTKAFNDNRPWNEIATAFITADGDVRENGDTAIIMAQAGRPEETVAEVSRIFLGIQIQCAQCHDHPFDDWTREQFHELAAFFPRVTLRPVRSDDKRSFTVVGNDRLRAPRKNANRYRGSPEHFMPDLDDPAAQGTVMQPTFFVSGQSLPLGTTDAERRSTLAEWITATDNPWFSKSLVNRVWAELVGTGFFEPVDDIGPERDSVAPRTLEHLATEFTNHGHDLKWLIGTIMATEAYQRDSRSRSETGQREFLSNNPQRLRSDQLFSALQVAMFLEEGDLRRLAARAGGNRRGRDPRAMFASVFGYDPSEPREDINGSVPQALMLMNSPIVNRLISARRPRGLGELLRSSTADEPLVEELYLRCLSRPPTKPEIKKAIKHIRKVNNRAEGFEDLLWVLINSSEFMYRA